MKKMPELIKAIIVLPGTVLVFIPAGILYLTKPNFFLCGIPFPQAWFVVLAGLFLTSLGLFLAVRTVSLFFIVGNGTPGPWAPPKHFIVQGPYRFVRNPMLLGVLSILLAESLFFGSFPILIWFGVFFIMNDVYFRHFEEPSLAKRFGHEYVEYTKHVHRWIPRTTPWEKA